MTDGVRLDFHFGDIAETDCDAIVNPCGSGFLFGHAGVGGALAAAAGPDYAAECATLSVAEYEADMGLRLLVTGAGMLRAKYVIHAVSPTWNGGSRGEQEALRRVHEHVLRVATNRGCRSVALPAISTGSRRFPPEVAASIAVPTVEAFVQGGPHDRLAWLAAGGADSVLERVVFVFQSRAILHDYLARSNNPDHRDVLVAGLRDEITGHLRHAKRTHLAETVDKITDEATLRAIINEAQAAHGQRTVDGDHSEFGVGISTLYVRATQRVWGSIRAGSPPERLDRPHAASVPGQRQGYSRTLAQPNDPSPEGSAQRSLRVSWSARCNTAKSRSRRASN